MTKSTSILQFGEFTFDLNRQQLCKGKFRVRLSASQLRLLMLFLERPGELVSREAITQRLWKDTGTIDVERGINTAINSLRTTLGDSPTEPMFLETVIGLGYRFIAHVEECESASPTPESVPSPSMTDAENQAADPVADYSAGQAAQGATDAGEMGPVWRPGRNVFIIMTCTVVVMLLLAGLMWTLRRRLPQATRVKIPEVGFEPATFDYGSNQVSAAAVSPDGLKLAYADNFGISIHSFDGSPDRLLNSRPGLKISHLAWLPDNKSLLVSGIDAPSLEHQIWLIDPSAYNLLDLQDAGMAEPSSDGKTIAFTRNAGRELWTATTQGDNQRLVFTAPSGEEVRFLIWSRDGRYLMLSGHHPAGTPDRAALPPSAAWVYRSVDAHTGQVLSQTAGVEIDSGFLSDDGTLHYVNQAPAVGIVNKTHTTEMKTAVEPQTGSLTGTPSIEAELPAFQVRGMSASHDGVRKVFVFVRSALDIFVGRLGDSGTALKDKTPLTHAPWDSYPHAWTADGSVLFERSLDGRTAIFSQHPGSDEPQVLAQAAFDLFRPQLSPDGRSILFMGRQEHVNSLYRVPVSGGTPEEIPVQGEVEDYRCPLQAAATCVLSEPVGREAFAYYALDPVRGMGKELARTPWRPARLGAWNLSPDGAKIAVADDSSTNPGVEFITISTSAGAPHFLPFPGHGTVLAPAWSADGKVLYIECRTKSGFSLMYHKFTDEKGSRRQEGVIETSSYLIYGVPSPDGKNMAFPLLTTATNVWVTKSR